MQVEVDMSGQTKGYRDNWIEIESTVVIDILHSIKHCVYNEEIFLTGI